jgi:hypothetical protein
MRIFLLAAVFALPVLCQEAPAGAPPQRQRRPMPEPKNLKVLKVPKEQLIPTMRGWSQALGVQCNFCHVQGDFASDENPHKGMARKMVTMLDQVNSNFDGKPEVSCWTCHRGDTEPVKAPPLAERNERRGPPPQQEQHN